MWDKIKEVTTTWTIYNWVEISLLLLILWNVWQMFQALIAPVANLVGTYIKGKQEKAKLKTQVELTKLQATKKKIEKDGMWEEKAMSASDNSWKDEAWTLTFIAIILASFIPALQPYMQQGFVFLKNDCPDWVSYGILASIAGSFGLKGIAKIRK